MRNGKPLLAEGPQPRMLIHICCNGPVHYIPDLFLCLKITHGRSLFNMSLYETALQVFFLPFWEEHVYHLSIRDVLTIFLHFSASRRGLGPEKTASR
jgi:hypothetical protein